MPGGTAQYPRGRIPLRVMQRRFAPRGLWQGTPGYGGGGAALTGAAMLVYVDAAIAEGRNTGIYLHEIIQTGSPTSTQTLMSDLITFIDGCATRAAAGKCDFVTQTQLPVA